MSQYVEVKRAAQRVIDITASGGAWPISEAWEDFEAAANPATVLAMIADAEQVLAENEKMRMALIKSHEFIMNDAQTRRMCDETGQVSPLFPKRVGILAEILAAAGKEPKS